MNRCPVCSAELTGSGIRCPACGASLTVAHPTLKQPSPASGGQRKSSSATTTSSSQGSFIAGTVLDGRYRIVALLGRGGMGEVYKAEDLKLDHQVALKFLPDSFANDPAALTRFRSEVRIARQVTHQHVCRVFDIGDFEGQHFLSMEFIDGEDLSSLLRRIGRLPSDKALEVSRQICAGLSAAHVAGVLHRDLKPANVMIDGRGKARITDFGIAGLEEELKKGGVIAGTPAYMSPEQITGGEITTKSDIYSLGLVLYELFTGKPAFQSDSISELVHKHQTITPTNPSEILQEIDPLVEKAILRCLEKDPQLRPESALQVAAMLPGGDPLAAALAAGETPSPEMVAAAPTEGALKPVVAFTGLAAGIVMIAVSMYASMFVLAPNRVPFDQSAEVMSARANEVTRKLGYTGTTAERFYRFYPDTSYQNYLSQNPSPGGWDKISTGQPLVIGFAERQGPRYFRMFMLGSGYWTFGEQTESGMRTIVLDTRGRLIEFSAVPPQFVEKPAEQTSADWTPAFLAAELDQAKFTAGVPQWTPPSAYDMRAAWTGVLPDHAEIPIRVEAAAFQGKLVSFRIVYPWTKPDEHVRDSYSTRDWIGVFIFAGLVIGIIVVAAFLVRKHLRSGSGDRRGAFKTSLFVFLVTVFGYLLTMDHVASFFPELDRFGHSIRIGLFLAVLTWLIYLALEPIVRRRMPELIVSWNRLLAGDWRDPLIGRDVLLGALWGIGHCVLIYLGFLAERLAYGDRKVWLTNESLIGLRSALSMNLSSAGLGVIIGVLTTCLLVIISLVVRRKLYAAIILFLLLTTGEVLFFTHSFVNLPFTLAIGLFGTLVVARAGLLATVVSGIVFSWMTTTVLTLNFSAWYANGMFITVGLIMALLIYGFKVSLANRPLFGNRLAPE